MRLTKIIFFLLFFFILNNCQSFQETMTGAGKKKETDAFLVKKKDPLILPPNFEELPLPNSNKEQQNKSVESLIGSSKNLKENEGSISELEKIILKELKKN
tara:strand:- start:118 stop:420 length:303 start_codon:yes stop_codon:yes gene_type:complete